MARRKVRFTITLNLSIASVVMDVPSTTNLRPLDGMIVCMSPTWFHELLRIPTPVVMAKDRRNGTSGRKQTLRFCHYFASRCQFAAADPAKKFDLLSLPEWFQTLGKFLY
jgi:hypothetical protein